MRVLILGGTGFVGRAAMDICLARDDEVTLFHRGRSIPEPFPDVEHVIGDREVGIDALRGRRWDVIVDPGGFEVKAVRATARLLADRYVFVSSISVYRDPSNMDEFGPLCEVEDAENAKLSLETYGGLKAACERALEQERAKTVLHVRAGLILGPHDYDLRFPWWLRRIARGGETLAPGNPEAHVQAIDVRDLAAWMCTTNKTGAFNATGKPMTMLSLFETMREVTKSDARFVWVPDELLLKHGVAPYSEMPFWLPASIGARCVPIDRAGLSLRPFAETARDTWAWLQTGWDKEASVRANRRFHVPAGISDEREARIREEFLGPRTLK